MIKPAADLLGFHQDFIRLSISKNLIEEKWIFLNIEVLHKRKLSQSIKYKKHKSNNF